MARAPLTAAIVVLAILAIAASVAERSSEWVRLKEIARSRSVPGSAVGSTRFARALGALELLHPIPRRRRRDTPAARLGAVPAARGSTPDLLSLDPRRGPRLLNAYRLDRGGLATKAPVVSLLLPRADLKEMHSTPFRRGRRSERAGFLGFFDVGEPLLTTGVGVRIHGGGSRGARSRLGYRLTARRRYGKPVFSPAPFAERRDHLPKQLVLRSLTGPDRHNHIWHFASPLAMDIARRVGAEAPRSRPVGLYLNGSFEGVYELADYLGRDFVSSRYGLDDFTLVRTKRNPYESGSRVKEGPPEAYEQLELRVRNLKNDPAPERAGEWVNLDNLYRWLIAVTFVDTSDVFQGPLIRDLADPSARWFWIAWDLDLSFGVALHPRDLGWRRNSVRKMIENTRNDVRRKLFQRLMKSPAQRQRFVGLAVETLNHRIQPAFLEERLAFYRHQAELFGIEDRAFLAEMTDYLRQRPGAYRQHLRASFDLGPSHRVRVTGRTGSSLEIDGYPTALPWEGEYFDGMTVRLEPALAGPAGFSIAGAPATLVSGPLEITVHADHEIALLPDQEYADRR